MKEPSARRRTTLADVAARAGVSTATASRALAGDDRISEPTRALVRHAAAVLEYVPNLAARGLRSRRSRALGLLLADLSDPVHGQVAAGFEVEASASGYSVIMIAAGGDREQERAALTVFAERSTDGICVASSPLHPEEMRSRVGSSPLVLIQPDHEMLLSGTGALPDGTIRTDDASGVSQAVLHLLEEGHHDIAYLGAGDGATDRLRRSTARLTLREEADVVMRTFQVGQDGWTTPAATAEIVRGELPGAVICYDDKLALALLDGLRAFGIEVPRDVSVVGFDGIPFAALSNPRLTTVIAGAEEMGRLAARMLVGAVTSGQLDAPRVLPVDLVVRESSGPPRKRRPRVRRTLSSMAGGRPAGGGS